MGDTMLAQGMQQKLCDLKATMRNENVNPADGLPEELFLFSTTLSPVVNVDLLVVNNNHEFLLLQRSDEHNGVGWHFPGGCIRFKETIESRIRKCALEELKCEVIYQRQSPIVLENIVDFERNISDQNERAHFISLVYKCKLPDKFQIQEHMKWFRALPSDLVKTQRAYADNWKEIQIRI